MLLSLAGVSKSLCCSPLARFTSPRRPRTAQRRRLSVAKLRTVAAMPDQGDTLLHRVRGLVSGANWRATKFATAVPPHLTCGLCGVISQTTFLLPCFHTLCESCVSHSANDGNAACPFDEEPFTVGDCQKYQLPPDTANKLKACCWNGPRGCTFVGTLQAVLMHYERECAFHAVSCPRCKGLVVHQDLPRHYKGGCHGEIIAPAPEQPTLHQRSIISADDIGTCLDELKALIRDPYQDRLPALQSKLNEVLEEARSIGTQVEAVTRAFSDSEDRLKQALGELSRSFGLKLQYLETALCDNLKKPCHAISDQVKSNGMQLDAIARTLSDSDRRLSDQLTQSRGELSTTFGHELRSQLCELSAQLTEISGVGRNEATEAETTSANGMPWRLEKRHILRKLELLATDSHAYLELLRLKADQQLKQPVAEYRPLFSSPYESIVQMSPFLGKLESNEKGYVVTLTNVNDLSNSWKHICQFTRWYRRDKYLQVATLLSWSCSRQLILSVYLKWGGTLGGSFPTSRKADVYVTHADNREAHIPAKMSSTCSGSHPGHCGFQDQFFATIDDPKQLGFVKDGRLTFVISFTNNTAES